MFLAVTTLAFAVALDSFFLNPTNFPNFVPGSIPRPVLFGRFDLESEWVMYYLTLAFLVLTIFAALGIRKARSGRALLATRDNYRAAAAAAVPTTTAKLSGFVLSGVVAGVAGGLFILILRGARAGTFQPGLSTGGVLVGGHRRPRLDLRRADRRVHGPDAVAGPVR